MSAEEGIWKETADHIKARLERLELMDGIEVIVDQQKNIESLIAQNVGKLGGAAVILFQGADPVDERCELMDANYTVRIYGAPILRPGGVPVEVLVQVAIRALSKWNPDGATDTFAKHCNYSFTVTGGIELLPVATYVAYEFPVRRRVVVPAPEFKPITPPPTDP